MNAPYEILLRWDDTGVFSGGHTIRRETDTGRISAPLPLGKDGGFPWAEAGKEINAALTEALAASSAALADTTVELETERAAVAARTAERDAAQLVVDAVKLTLPNDFHPGALIIKGAEDAKAEAARAASLSEKQLRREQLERELAALTAEES